MAAEDKKYFVKASIVKLDLEVGKKGDIKMEPALLVPQDARLLAQRELDFQHETGIYRPVLEAVKPTRPIYLPLYIPFVAEASRPGRPSRLLCVHRPFCGWLRKVSVPRHRRSILT